MNVKLNRELQEQCINTIRILSADAVQNANAGHPGMPMGAAAMAYTLWTQFLKTQPEESAVVRPRSIRALHRTRVDAVVQPAVPLRLRSANRGDPSFQEVGQQDTGPPGARPDARRRGHHGATRTGFRQRRRPGHCRSVARTAL